MYPTLQCTMYLWPIFLVCIAYPPGKLDYKLVEQRSLLKSSELHPLNRVCSSWLQSLLRWILSSVNAPCNKDIHLDVSHVNVNDRSYDLTILMHQLSVRIANLQKPSLLARSQKCTMVTHLAHNHRTSKRILDISHCVSLVCQHTHVA